SQPGVCGHQLGDDNSEQSSSDAKTHTSDDVRQSAREADLIRRFPTAQAQRFGQFEPDGIQIFNPGGGIQNNRHGGDFEDHDHFGNHADAEPDDNQRHDSDNRDRIECGDPRVHDFVKPSVHTHEIAHDNADD